MKYHKQLSKFYIQWYEDAISSAAYCEGKGYPTAAKEYLDDAAKCKQIIEENKEAIEFFSVDDNAHKIDSALPAKFRGYK